ncbi:MAG: GGDEF domain-containing protein [Candidatus Omnitrophica bacterium]|nr:GGDEF domain-containing protein [Candidatus Omnitrophota bacterium]
MSVSAAGLYLLYAVLIAVFWILLEWSLARRLGRLASLYDRLNKEEASLRADYALLAQETGRLKSLLEGVVAPYEITRELTGFLDLEKVLRTFNEAVQRYLSVQDCVFVSTGQGDAGFEGYQAFPLHVGKEPVGSLMVKGLHQKDQETFGILFAQFQLAVKRVLLYQRVQALATTDSLTRSYSRRYWFARCAEELERSRKFGFDLACLMIDVDHFKELNDGYGHLVGDAIVAAVAKIIKDNIRSIDLLGRYGGEEFSLVLTETDVQGALYVAERIRQTVADTPIQAYDESLRVTISIGIMQLAKDTPDLAALVDSADKALYLAKETGRNRVCVQRGP